MSERRDITPPNPANPSQQQAGRTLYGPAQLTYPPTLARPFTPAASGASAIAYFSSPVPSFYLGAEIQIPYATTGLAPFTGLITKIAGCEVTIETAASGSSGSGVTSLNGETGALTLAAGTGLTLTTSGTTITAALVVPVTAADGGTGLTSPGTSGNVLTSTGSAWASSAPSSSGVTSITDSSSATGAITFTGSGVSQSGTTFTFSGGSSGSNAFDADVIAGTYAAAPTNYYEMKDASGATCTDAMGNNNGTYTGIAAYAVAQLCADTHPVPYFLSSTPSYATLNDPTTSSTSFTVMIAFAAGINSAPEVLISNYTGGANYFLIYTNSAGQPFGQWSGGAVQFGGTANTPTLCFITFNSSTSTAVFYCNGIPGYTITSTSYTKQGSGIVVGRNPTGSTPWTGIAGKVGLWGATCLTQAQIYNLTSQFLWNN